MSNSNKKNEEKIPIFQSIYCAILFTLIIFRIALKNVGLYINLANYISMVVSIAFVFNASVPKIHPEWRRNLCKSIFLLILLALIIAGFCVLVFRLISSGEQCTETFPYIAFFRVMGKFCKNIPRTGHCHYFLFSEHGKHLHIGVKLTSQIHMKIRADL